MSDKLSKSKRNSLIEGKINKQTISSVLIGQLSKNYSMALNYTIDDTDLLSFVFGTIPEVYNAIGLDLVCLKYKDVSRLKEFYECNHFESYVDSNNNLIYTGKESHLL